MAAAVRKVLVVGLGVNFIHAFLLRKGSRLNQNYISPNTLHSYGQALVDQIATRAASELGQGDAHLVLRKDLNGWHKAFSLPSCELHLYKPKALMNINGPSVKKAALEILGSPTTYKAALVCAHDELEMARGVYKWKRGGSDKGHRGLASVTAALGSKEYQKFALGIGRPVSRSPDAVARHVLSPLLRDDLAAIQFDRAGKQCGPILSKAWNDIHLIADSL